MGCTTSCVSPSMAELNKSVKAGDDRALLLQLSQSPKLLSTPISVLSSTGVTPLHQACESKQVKVVQQILSFMSCSSLDIVREALLPYCKRVGSSLPTSVADAVKMTLDMTNAKGQTPLMYACFAGCPDLVKLLLTQGADPWAGDRCGRRTALHYAAMGGSSPCIQALMKHVPARLLVRQGVRYVDARSLCGLTPLHYCIYFGNLEALRELLHHFDPHIGAVTTSESYDVSVTCEARSSPLHFAAVAGNEEAAREVLRYVYQRMSSSQALSDPRAKVNAAGQMPWQVALAHHPANIRLASLLHPGQPLERVVAVGEEDSGAAGGGMGMGPPSLATLAATALRSKLLADLQGVKEAAERGEEQEKQEHQRAEAKDPEVGLAAELVAERTSHQRCPVQPCQVGAARGSPATPAVPAALSVQPAAPLQRPGAGSGSGGAEISPSPSRAGGRGRRSAAVTPLPAAFAAAASAPATQDVSRSPGFGGSGTAWSCGSESGSVASSSATAQPASAAVGNEMVPRRPGEGPAGEACGAACATDNDDCEGGADGVDEAAGRPQCEVCFAARVTVTPAGCRHGLCGGCAEQLCRGVTRKPLHCPFCRRAVAGFVAAVNA